MARKDRNKAAARRKAAVQRAQANTGATNRDVARERREALAALTPSAGRILAQIDGQPRSVDTVVTAIAFGRDLLALKGAGNEDARLRAAIIHRALCQPIPHVLPSGASLAEALEVDLASLPGGAHDGAVTLAEHLATLGRRHDAGEVDLYARVAPPGLDRHELADDVDLVCAAVMPEGAADDASLPRLLLVTEQGWLDVWPEAAIAAHSLGVLTGASADAVGEGLHAWLTSARAQAVAADGPDALPAIFGGRDVVAARQAAERSAGGDHPKIAGPVLLDLLAPPT